VAVNISLLSLSFSLSLLEVQPIMGQVPSLALGTCEFHQLFLDQLKA